MGKEKNTAGTSRYDSEEYNRKGSRYASAAYNRKGSRYEDKAEGNKGKKKSYKKKAVLQAEKSAGRKAFRTDRRKEEENTAAVEPETLNETVTDTELQKIGTEMQEETAAAAEYPEYLETEEAFEEVREGGAEEELGEEPRIEEEEEPEAASEGDTNITEEAENEPEEMSAREPETSAADGVWEHLQEHVTGRRLAAAVIAAAAVGLYAGQAVRYSGHFYPGTTALGMDCSGMSAEEVREKIEDTIGNYRLTVKERSGEESLIYASQIALSYVENDTLESTLREQKSMLWPFRMKQGSATQIPVQTAYSDEELSEVFEDLPCLDEDTMTAPEDARLVYENNRLAVQPEVMGSTLDVEKTQAAIAAALDEGADKISLEQAGCYIDPEVYADDPDLLAESEGKNAILGACLTLNFGDRLEMIDAERIESWLIQDSDGSYSLDEGAVWDYTAYLAQTYDTYGGERVFYTTIGTTEYLYGGDYGWQIEQSETAQTILNAIRDKEVKTMDPVYVHTAKSRFADDIGDTYVEICIARQQMWLYQNGEIIVDTPVVTGNISKNYDTPAGGVWAIDGKYLNFTLVGADYRTPVSYWMPFNGGVGIHDLQSRAYFGGTIYLTNGSHGCVNTPLAAVSEIYDHVDVGTPVIVYIGET